MVKTGLIDVAKRDGVPAIDVKCLYCGTVAVDATVAVRLPSARCSQVTGGSLTAVRRYKYEDVSVIRAGNI